MSCVRADDCLYINANRRRGIIHLKATANTNLHRALRDIDLYYEQ